MTEEAFFLESTCSPFTLKGTRGCLTRYGIFPVMAHPVMKCNYNYLLELANCVHILGY
jgi:hypothetical protein